MRIVAFLVILILVVFFGFQVYRLNSQRLELDARASQADEQVRALEAENERLTADIEYFSDIRNLVKELKGLFNYRKPGEKLFIIIPTDPAPTPSP